MKKLFNKDQKGFTIIEVMIVLAIAGLIIGVVLVAIPQLQRNQRNTARKSVLNRIKTEIDSYSGNNNGAVPAASIAAGTNNFGEALTDGTVFDRYFDCSGAGVLRICAINVNDPKTGFPMGISTTGTSWTTVVAAGVGQPSGGLVASTNPGFINYSINAVCFGEGVTSTGASARNYALQVQLEGGAIYCIDNK